MVVESFFDSTATVLTVVGPLVAEDGFALPGLPDELHPAAMTPTRASDTSRHFIALPPCEFRTSGSRGLPDRARATAWKRCAAPARKPSGEEKALPGWRRQV